MKRVYIDNHSEVLCERITSSAIYQIFQILLVELQQDSSHSLKSGAGSIVKRT